MKNISWDLLHSVIFTFLLLIIIISFFHEKTSRIIYYWCGYLSIIGLFSNLAKKEKIYFREKINFLFLPLACLFFIWFIYCKCNVISVSSEWLFQCGKRWLIASIISLYIFNNKHNKNLIFNSKIIIFIMIFSFLNSSLFGIIQFIHANNRILLGINRATLTAYAYSTFSLSLSAIVFVTMKKKCKYILQSIIITISTCIIFLTQTRSAMFIHPILELFLSLSWIKREKLYNIKILFFLLLLIIISIFLNKEIFINRYNSTIQEIIQYKQGNDYTSLGSRISMWKLGLMTFINHPFGQSEFERNQWITQYLNKIQVNSFALQFLKIHLHNELIQFASIFGIFGIIVLFYFFYNSIFKLSYPPVIGPIGISSISILLYGMTDVLLISKEMIIIFSTTIIVSHFLCKKN